LRVRSALLSNLRIDVRPSFPLDALAALLADPRIELRAVLLAYSLPTMLGLLRSPFGSTFVVCHRKFRLSQTSYTHIYPTYEAVRHPSVRISRCFPTAPDALVAFVHAPHGWLSMPL